MEENMGKDEGGSGNDNTSRIRRDQPWGNRRRPGETVVRGIAPEFADSAHHGEVARIGLELQIMRRTGSRQGKRMVMNMQMRRYVQAAGMGMQKRRQALQERQHQEQEIILSFLSHGRILTPAFHERQFFGPWQNRIRGVRMRLVACLSGVQNPTTRAI